MFGFLNLTNLELEQLLSELTSLLVAQLLIVESTFLLLRKNVPACKRATRRQTETASILIGCFLLIVLWSIFPRNHNIAASAMLILSLVFYYSTKSIAKQKNQKL